MLRNVSTSDSGIYVCFATLPVPTATTRTGTAIATATIAATTTAATAAAATTSTLTEEERQQQRKQEQAQRKVEEAQGEGNKMPEEPKQLDKEQEEEEEQKYQAFQRIKLTVRTTPGPVTQLYFKASTILGFLIWRFNKTQSGGYPVRSFTAEYRNISYRTPPANASYEHEWSRMDPINIAPNVVSMMGSHTSCNGTKRICNVHNILTTIISVP